MPRYSCEIKTVCMGNRIEMAKYFKTKTKKKKKQIENQSWSKLRALKTQFLQKYLFWMHQEDILIC